MRKARSVLGRRKQSPPEGDEVTASRLLPQVGMMLRAFWAAPTRNVLLSLAAAIFSSIVATAYGQIRLNRWNEPFYDALSRRDLADSPAAGRVWRHRRSAVDSQCGAAMADRDDKAQVARGPDRGILSRTGCVPGRAFRLANAGPIGVNPDQRMHEDARHLTELSADLGIGLLQASILLVVFIESALGSVRRFRLPFRWPAPWRSPATWSGRASCMPDRPRC